jgi:hypothetical protein
MPSSTTTTQSYPVAVLDSGGSQMLFGNRDMINSIYGAYGSEFAKARMEPINSLKLIMTFPPSFASWAGFRRDL